MLANTRTRPNRPLANHRATSSLGALSSSGVPGHIADCRATDPNTDSANGSGTTAAARSTITASGRSTRHFSSMVRSCGSVAEHRSPSIRTTVLVPTWLTVQFIPGISSFLPCEAANPT